MAKKTLKQSLVRGTAEGKVLYSDQPGERSGRTRAGADTEPIPHAPYGSQALAVAHGLAADLHAAGLYSSRTMREFDKLCLTPVRPILPDDIKALRASERVSQAVLAAYLNVTTSSIAQWERGEKRPSGAAQKLLALALDKGLAAIA